MSATHPFKSLLIVLALSTCAAAADPAKPADPAAKPPAEKVAEKVAVPEHPEKVIYDAASAFEFLKSLAGDWEMTSSDHDHGAMTNVINYRPTAAGSAVIETLFEGDPMEMISMYHMDGDTLLMTHYCALQNAPILKFEKSDKPGEIKFVFVGGTNFDPKSDMHMHEGTWQIKDANTIESKFVGWSNGKAEHSSSGTIQRKAAGGAKSAHKAGH